MQNYLMCLGIQFDPENITVRFSRSQQDTLIRISDALKQRLF